MIDLHLHFDGSLPDEVLDQLARREGVSLPPRGTEAFKRCFRVSDACRDLNEYLDKFSLPLKLLQTPENLEDAMEGLCRELLAEGELYCEIRFAPQYHTGKGMTQEEAVLAALAGMNRARKAAVLYQVSGWTPEFQLILCCMRGKGNEEQNIETIRLVKKYLHQGVAAADLAGAEALFPTAGYKELFLQAGSMGVPFTIHAGEAAGAESVWDAVAFGAARIGHGIRAYEDEGLIKELKDRQIPLECCPISNCHTKAIPKDHAYPLREYLMQGLCVTVNTDNRTVSDTTPEKEYAFLRKTLGLTAKEEQQLLFHAVQAAFLSEEEKRRLRTALEERVKCIKKEKDRESRSAAEQIQKRLFELSDETYRAFHCRLIPTVAPETVIGVRTPVLRSFAKELAGTPQAEAFLGMLPHTYYDENNLHGFLIESIKEYDACIRAVNEFLPYVDNWATCDMMSPKALKKNLPALWEQVKAWISSGHTYTIRYGLDTLMRFFMKDAFREEQLELAASVVSEDYYVKMAAAWYFATALTKQYKAALPYIEQRRLDPWVHKKAVQKAAESVQISEERKSYLRSIRSV